jgi:hypothetical protein
MTGEQVIIAKMRFATLAPIRLYKIRGTPLISCADDTCDVQGIMDWRTVNQQGEVESGLATFAYKVQWVGKLQIILETSKVVTAQPAASPPMAYQPPTPKAKSQWQAECLKRGHGKACY